MPLDRLAGLAATALLCAACAAAPPAAQQTTAEPAPQVEDFHPGEQLLALAPGRHAYVRQQVWQGTYQGDVSQPAWIKLTQSADHFSADVVISSGNPSFDQAALNSTPARNVEYAGSGDTPATTMLCVFAGHGCPADSPWKDGSTLRSLSDIQRVFDRGKEGLIAAYNRALRRGQVAGDGTVVLSLTIAPSGTVEQCSIEQTNFSDENFLNRLLNVACGFNFGAAEVASTRILRYPLHFHPM